MGVLIRLLLVPTSGRSSDATSIQQRRRRRSPSTPQRTRLLHVHLRRRRTTTPRLGLLPREPKNAVVFLHNRRGPTPSGTSSGDASGNRVDRWRRSGARRFGYGTGQIIGLIVYLHLAQPMAKCRRCTPVLRIADLGWRKGGEGLDLRPAPVYHRPRRRRRGHRRPTCAGDGQVVDGAGAAVRKEMWRV